MTKLKIACLIAIAALFNSCSNKDATTPRKTESEQSKTLSASIVNSSDPVCGMDVDKNDLGDTASYRQKLYGFCSTDCKDKFVAKPADYIK